MEAASYNKDFVNREDQTEEVKKRLNTIRLGQTVFDSVLEWYGIPGIGKTTLSQIAIVKICQEMQIPYAHIDFEPERNKNAGKYTGGPVLILEDILKKISVNDPAEFKKTLEKYREASDENLQEERKKQVISKFISYIKELLKDKPVALLFDTTEKADPETTAWLEKEIISPLCLTGRCIIIWTGRFPQRWQQFEVRRRVTAKKLEPLSLKATMEQVHQTDDKIYQISGGFPLGNNQLFKVITGFKEKQESYEDKDLINALDSIIEQWVMKDIPAELNAACRVLTIVRQFDVIILRRLLSKFVPHFEKAENFLKIIGQLTETSLVEWDPVRKGYALDSTLRHILNLHLQENDSKRYSEINEFASEIYKEWIEKVRENRSIYIVERLYHEAKIAKSKGDKQSQIAHKLEEKLKGYLEKYYQKSEFADADTDRLYKELENDNELEKILGIHGFVLLKEAVK